MRSVKVFKYGEYSNHEFEKLPKGNMLEIVMNPYNGNVFVTTEKHETSTRISLQIMRELVRACDSLERKGSLDPLRDLLLSCDGENWDELSKAARAEVIAFRERSATDEKGNAAGSGADVRKVG